MLLKFRLCLSHLNNRVRTCLIHTYHAVPLPCRFASDFSRPGHSTAGARYGMCELTSTVSRQPVADLPRFDLFRLPRGVSRLAVRIFSGNTRTFTNDIALSDNGKGTAWHVCVRATRQGRDTAWYIN